MDLSLLVWGFRPAWAKRAWINSRAETLYSSRAFASAARRRRCLVPAIGWYEWQGESAPRQPYVFQIEGFVPFAFAGVWTARETPEGWERSFSIVTTEAKGELARIHHRKPVALARESQAAWLDPDLDQPAAETLLATSNGRFAAYPVSTFVNKPENDGPECVAPLDR